MAKDKELADHERAHSGVPGSKVRHGQDALHRAPKAQRAAIDDFGPVEGAREGVIEALGGAFAHKDGDK